MNVPQLDLATQHTALLPMLRDVFEKATTDAAFVLGPAVSEFECDLAGACESRQAVGMSSGTDALMASLMALDIGAGDEVITTPFTFFATAGVIARCGATPVFVDILPDTFNIDPAAIEAAITKRTRAIMPVHVYGLPVDMNALMAVAQKHGLKVIEDAAQAIGARYHGKAVGAIGDVGALSFYPTKNLAALGDAGACVTNDEELATTLREVRLHGMGGDYLHHRIGGNFRLDALQARFLQIKLQYLEAWTRSRQVTAAGYNEGLTGLPLTLPAVADGYEHVYHQYTVRVPDGRRDELQKHLTAAGIGCRVYYPLPLHLQPCFEYLGGCEGQMPESERAAREVLSLPMFPELTDDQRRAVIAATRAFFE